MAKVTEQEIIEQIKKIQKEDVEFLNSYAPHLADITELGKFETDEKEAEKDFNEAKNDLATFIKEYGFEDEITHSHSERCSDPRDGYDTYYDILVKFNGVEIGTSSGSWYSHTSPQEKLSYLKDFLKKYEKSERELPELAKDPDLLKYNELLNQLKELESKTGLQKLIASLKIAQIKRQLLKLYPKVEQYNKLAEFVKNNKENYLKAQEVIKLLEEKINKLNKAEYLKEDFTYKHEYHSNSRYSQNENLKKEVNARIKNARNFLLIKYYKEHKEEFQNTRRPLNMIYSENTSKEFQKQFKDFYLAYDRAVVIAKEEGKDFDKLKPEEQFEYFEAAQKVLEIENKFEGTNQDHKE